MRDEPSLRRDLVTGRWSVVAPGRIKTPRDVAHATTLVRDASSCPFCPGHEAETEVEHARITGPEGAWLVRSVGNRFPMMAEGVSGARSAVDAPAEGQHEVIIETPEHDTDLAALSDEHLALVLMLYRDRFAALARRRGTRAVAMFKNRGPRSGASLRHPHGQLVALPRVPEGVALRDRRARRYAMIHGRPLIEQLRVEALEARHRVVADTPEWTAFCPYAPARAHEIFLVPTRPCPRWDALDADALWGLAQQLGDVLRRQQRVTEGADYNLVFRASALTQANEPFSRVWVEVITRRGGDAGFELSTGWSVAAVAPEESARQLREAL